MRILLRGAVWMVVACAVLLPAAAATPSEFYLTMLQRGIAAHDAGRFEDAASSLRIAAFGFVDSVEQYQLAQLYLALSYDRMAEADRARDAAHKVVAAERLQRRYATLTIPAATRANFEALARRALTAADLEVLGRAAEGGVAPPTAQVAEQAKPEPTPVKPEPVKPEPVKPEPVKPEPVKPEPVKPEPVKPEPVKPEPARAAAVPPQSKAAAEPPHSEKQPSNPATQQPKPAPPPPRQPDTRTTPTINVPARFAEADRALTAAKLADARAIYRELLEKASLQRADLLRLAEGFYRARDFSNALRTFERLGQLRRGEEPYRYYIAVALYETGQYKRAKEEIAAVLPFIEVTPDVERYRVKIEGSLN